MVRLARARFDRLVEKYGGRYNAERALNAAGFTYGGEKHGDGWYRELYSGRAGRKFTAAKADKAHAVDQFIREHRLLARGTVRDMELEDVRVPHRSLFHQDNHGVPGIVANGYGGKNWPESRRDKSGKWVPDKTPYPGLTRDQIGRHPDNAKTNGIVDQFARWPQAGHADHWLYDITACFDMFTQVALDNPDMAAYGDYAVEHDFTYIEEEGDRTREVVRITITISTTLDNIRAIQLAADAEVGRTGATGARADRVYAEEFVRLLFPQHPIILRLIALRIQPKKGRWSPS